MAEWIDGWLAALIKDGWLDGYRLDRLLVAWIDDNVLM